MRCAARCSGRSTKWCRRIWRASAQSDLCPDMAGFDWSAFLAGLQPAVEHRGSPHRRAGRPDHPCRSDRARRRRPAGDFGRGCRHLRPPLVQAQSGRQRRRRHRPPDAHRERARPHSGRLSRIARRQRAIRRRRWRHRAVGPDECGTAAGAAVRERRLHRTADQAAGRSGARRERAVVAQAGDHRRIGRHARRFRARARARLRRCVVEDLQGFVQVADQPRSLREVEQRGA